MFSKLFSVNVQVTAAAAYALPLHTATVQKLRKLRLRRNIRVNTEPGPVLLYALRDTMSFVFF